jgi:ABC-type multidrug transport system ATPase subunit
MIIQTEGLTKRFGRKKAVADLNLAVAEGSALALIGANGAGKTTTLRMLVNLLRPDAGAAQILGVDRRPGSGPIAPDAPSGSSTADLPATPPWPPRRRGA